MLGYEFMQHAFEAGTIVAIIAGITGYFVVLRRSAFTAHAFSEIGFTGAAGAVLLGIAPIAGLLLGSSMGALAIAVLGRRAVVVTHEPSLLRPKSADDLNAIWLFTQGDAPTNLGQAVLNEQRERVNHARYRRFCS